MNKHILKIIHSRVLFFKRRAPALACIFRGHCVTVEEEKRVTLAGAFEKENTRMDYFTTPGLQIGLRENFRKKIQQKK